MSEIAFDNQNGDEKDDGAGWSSSMANLLPPPAAAVGAPAPRRFKNENEHYTNNIPGKHYHPIFVSSFVSNHPSSNKDGGNQLYKSKEERKRATRWRELKYIYDHIKGQSRFISVEKTLWVKDYITCREFVNAMIGAFRFTAEDTNRRSGLDTHLRRLYRYV